MNTPKSLIHSAGQLLTALVGLPVVALVLLANLKGCVVTPWKSPSEPEAYHLEGGDGPSAYLVLLPDNRVILERLDDNGVEAALVQWKGEIGSHLVSKLWHIEGPGVHFGYRVYPPGLQPVNMEMTTLRKAKVGTGDSAFPREGAMAYAVVLFGEDRVVIDDMRFDRVTLDAPFLTALKSMVGVN